MRVFGAVILCGLIGLEREFHKNTAGLRTNMLIGLAAVTFCIITIHMMETMAEGHEAARLDPIRLVEAVTAGIAFLAAGVVVYTRGDVKGLTTGASMWLSAAIGLSAGLGMWPLAPCRRRRRYRCPLDAPALAGGHRHQGGLTGISRNGRDRRPGPCRH